jgi:hypothetical protein
MKKLLALILCVVMVMSLAPAAFAANEGTTGGVRVVNADQDPSFADLSVANSVITKLNKDIKALYTATAANETVFQSAKGIYDFTDSLAKELLKDTEKVKFPDGTTIYNEDLSSNLRKALNHVIGDEIRNYMNDRVDAFTNGNGRIQPDKYLNTYVKALNNTLGSAKAQKNIQALVLSIATMSAMQKANDAADDLYDAIKDWDHWNEFNWGDIDTMDPDGRYATAWLPTDTTLIPSGSWAALNQSIDGRYALYGWLNNDPSSSVAPVPAGTGNENVWPNELFGLVG